MRCLEHAACTGEIRSTYKILVGKPAGKILLARPTLKFEGNIKMNPKK
jgi:hypothetical protein